MPITMTCIGCMKRFRARDESVGKRVKCPYCATAMEVPLPSPPAGGAAAYSSSDGSSPRAAPSLASGQTPTQDPSSPVIPSSSWSPTTASPLLTPPLPASSPPALPGGAPSAPLPAPPPLTPPETRLFQPDPAAHGPLQHGQFADPPRAAGRPVAAAPPAAPPPVEDELIRGWRRARRGLGWVLFGLVVLVVPALAEFGKTLYERLAGELPQGEGWIRIAGFINDEAPQAITLTKLQQLDILLYGLPLVIGGLAWTLGRLWCVGVPGRSGTRGLFAASAVATFTGGLGLGLLGVLFLFRGLDEMAWAVTATAIAIAAAEFWFLNALTAIGSYHRCESTPRRVGFLGLLLASWATVAAFGVPYYQDQMREWLSARWNVEHLVLAERGILAVAGLLTIIVYWRAVSSVRAAIADHLARID